MPSEENYQEAISNRGMIVSIYVPILTKQSSKQNIKTQGWSILSVSTQSITFIPGRDLTHIIPAFSKIIFP